MSFSDEELISATELCYKDIELNMYSITTSLEVFFWVVQFNEIGFNLDLETLKLYILDNIAETKVENRIDFSYLSYVIPTSEEMKTYIEEFKKEVRDRIDNQVIDGFDEVLNQLLQNKEQWHIMFKEASEDSQQTGAYGKSIFKYIDLDSLIKMIRDSTQRQIDEFRGILLSLYRNTNLDAYYKSDKEALYKFRLLVEDYRKDLENQNIRRYHIDLLISNLNSFVNGSKI